MCRSWVQDIFEVGCRTRDEVEDGDGDGGSGGHLYNFLLAPMTHKERDLP